MPTIRLPSDRTPQPSDVEDQDNDACPPTGDLADLTASVAQNAAAVQIGSAQGPAALPGHGSAARARIYKKPANKGVGKGASGSSGQPRKQRRQPTATASRSVQDSSDDEDDGDIQEVATQNITVGIRRGYSTFPAYLFDIPPKKLKTDNLRKKLMIAEIKRSHTQRRFFRKADIFMSHMKEFFRMYALANKFQGQNSNSEHGYALPIPEEDSNKSSSEEDNSDLCDV